MTVGELIIKLSDLDPTLEVVTQNTSFGERNDYAKEFGMGAYRRVGEPVEEVGVDHSVRMMWEDYPRVQVVNLG